MRSILQDEKECYICRTTLNLERHHVFGGWANRKIADKDGLWLWLCREHHTGARGVHQNRALDLKLKRIAQKKWMDVNGKGIEDFIARYGKSYL